VKAFYAFSLCILCLLCLSGVGLAAVPRPSSYVPLNLTAVTDIYAGSGYNLTLSAAASGNDNRTGYHPVGESSRLINANGEYYSTGLVDLQGNISTCVWINRSITGFYYAYTYSGGATNSNFFALWSRANGTFEARKTKANTDYIIASTGTAVSNNLWHFFCVTKNATDIWLYVDGKFNSSNRDDSEERNATTTDVITLGDPAADGNGCIYDEPQWWLNNTILTATDIADIYANESAHNFTFWDSAGGGSPPAGGAGITMNSASITANPDIAYRNSTLLGWCNASSDNGANINYNVTWYKNQKETFQCYQEQANASSSCGGLAGGVYSLTVGTWPNHYLGYDSNYQTYVGGYSPNYFMANYSKPRTALYGTRWVIADSDYPRQVLIPSICLNAYASQVGLRFVSTADPGAGASWECYNGTDYQVITTGADNNLFEEGILWNLTNLNASNYAINISSNVNNISEYKLNDLNATPQFSIRANDSFIIQCTALNSTNSSVPLNSSAFTIANFAPILSGVTFNNTEPDIGDWLRCNNGTITDIDTEQAWNYTYQWYKNGAVMAAYTTQDFGIQAEAVKGDNITCEQRVYDKFNISNAVNVTTTVLNFPPYLSNDLTFINASHSHSFYAYANATDEDLASDINHTEISYTATGSAACYYVKNVSTGNMFGSLWNCSGEGGNTVNISIRFTDKSGEWINSSYGVNTIPNHLPNISLLAPASDTTFTVNHIQFNFTGSDNDSDALSYNLYLGLSKTEMSSSYSTNGASNEVLTHTIDGLMNGTYFVNLTVSDGYATVVSSLYNFTILSPVLMVNASTLTGTAISAFAINLSSGSSFIYSSTTSGTIYINTSFLTYSYKATASGYGELTGTVIMNNAKNLSLEFLKTSAANIEIYYDQNNTLADNITTTINLFSTSYTLGTTTDTGTLYVDYLPSGDYTLEYTASGYYTLRYYFTMTTSVSANVKVYLVPDIASISEIHVTLSDSQGTLLPNYHIIAQKYFSNSGTYEFNQMALTDNNGIAILFLYPDSVFYKFVVEKDGTIYKTTEPRLADIDFYISLDASAEETPIWRRMGSIAYSLSYVNASGGYFRAIYLDTNGIVVTGCLDVISPSFTQLCYDCANASTATITCPVNSTNSSGAIASLIFFHYNSPDLHKVTLATLEESWTGAWQTIGSGGTFYAILIIAASVLLGVWHPALAIIMLIGGTIASGALGLYPLNYGAQVIFIIIGGVYLFMITKKQ